MVRVYMRKETKKKQKNIPLKTRNKTRSKTKSKTWNKTRNKTFLKSRNKTFLKSRNKTFLKSRNSLFSTLPLKLDRGGSLSQACPITDETEMMLVPL